ncbi:hypothetical protein CRE_16780 [Caenorhabditis remanei]|uniref:Uncharacterized protein n=1 Tax=Caenorhabditis remanei TaxID=31234 RepID=E3MB11_CAERE|nr:hypothetical protein CRE_16780 [Caenorhabditis remanei]
MIHPLTSHFYPPKKPKQSTFLKCSSMQSNRLSYISVKRSQVATHGTSFSIGYTGECTSIYKEISKPKKFSAEKPRMDNARQCHSAGVKLNINKELQDKLVFTDYDSSIKDKLTPYAPSTCLNMRLFRNCHPDNEKWNGPMSAAVGFELRK